MANMRMLIRIVFVIFIANGIDCLGGVCDNCCDCLKKKDENEEIKEYKNNTGIFLVNLNWYQSKKKDLVLRFFEKEKDNVFTSTGNENKISIKLDENYNSKIAYQDDELKLKDPLNLGGKKYAFFEIKTKKEDTVYLYCSDVGSSGDYMGIFVKKKHKGISVIAYDTENVMNMNDMFRECHSLTKLDLKNFNTKNVTNMEYMFSGCSSLEKLEFEENFDTTKVENMSHMFSGCSRLTELDLQYFNTTNVTNMEYMFFGCSSLKSLDLQNFNTSKVTEMADMFFDCSRLKKLKIGQNFNTRDNTDVDDMFFDCISFPKDIRNDLNNVKGIIDYFKKNK